MKRVLDLTFRSAALGMLLWAVAHHVSRDRSRSKAQALCVPHHMPAARQGLHPRQRGESVMDATIRRLWLPAATGVAVALSGVWIAALGYGLSKFF
jgi:type IV secretory pathway TrbD component